MEENYLKKELYELIAWDESIFEFIQSGALDGIWYWDLDQPENEWMSRKFWDTLGYDSIEKKHLASEWQGIVYDEDLPVVMENLEKHLKDPEYPFDQIVRYRHKNGSTVWIRCRGVAIRNTLGKPIRMLGAHSDISDLKSAELEISRLTEEYERVFNGTQDAMFLIRVLESGEFRYIRNNRSHQIKTGLILENLTSKTPKELLGDALGAFVESNYQKCVDKMNSITYEEELKLLTGDYVWLTTLTPIIQDEKVCYIVGSATDITDRKQLENQLSKNANYDKLTELPNRRLFFERLERAILENHRDDKHFALLFLDLDGFKYVNDAYGHKIGDEVLIAVGNRLQNAIRKSDTVARMGGDEFTIIARNIEDYHNIEVLVEKIQTSIKEVIKIGDIECFVNSSVGIARYPEHGKDSDTLLRNSDTAMYEVKKNGKNGFAFFNEKMVAHN